MYAIINQIDKTKSFITFDVILKDYTDVIQLEKSELLKAYNQFKFYRKDINTNCFSSELFRLMAKADHGNFSKILQGFPEHAIVYALWYNSPSEKAFYKLLDDINTQETKIEQPSITINKTVNVGISSIKGVL